MNALHVVLLLTCTAAAGGGVAEGAAKSAPQGAAWIAVAEEQTAVWAATAVARAAFAPLPRGAARLIAAPADVAELAPRDAVAALVRARARLPHAVAEALLGRQGSLAGSVPQLQAVCVDGSNRGGEAKVAAYLLRADGKLVTLAAKARFVATTQRTLFQTPQVKVVRALDSACAPAGFDGDVVKLRGQIVSIAPRPELPTGIVIADVAELLARSEARAQALFVPSAELLGLLADVEDLRFLDRTFDSLVAGGTGAGDDGAGDDGAGADGPHQASEAAAVEMLEAQLRNLGAGAPPPLAPTRARVTVSATSATVVLLDDVGHVAFQMRWLLRIPEDANRGREALLAAAPFGAALTSNMQVNGERWRKNKGVWARDDRSGP